MDWDELAPLTNEQSDAITQLQQIIRKQSPLVHDIDKTDIKLTEPPELASLPSNHQLRQRYKDLQSQQQKIIQSTDDLKYDMKYDDNDEDEQYKYRQKPLKFNYITYFKQQMLQQRNTPLQLTQKQQQSWNYLTENANYMRTVLDSIENLQTVMKKLNDIYKENEKQCAHIHNKCMHLIEEQKQLETQTHRLKEMVQYFADYNQIRARISSPKLIDVLSKDFHTIVTRINQCIAFLSHNKQYQESAQYLQNYMQLRRECLKFVKNYVQHRLDKARTEDHNENTQVSILEYRAAASVLRPLIFLIESEAKQCQEYASLLNELQQLILSERHNTLKDLVDTTINAYSKTRDIPNLIRASTSYVMMICLREYKLFNEFFDLDLTLKKSLLSIAVGRTKKRKVSRTPKLSSSAQSTGTVSPKATYKYISEASDKSVSDSEETDDDINIISGNKRISGLIKDLCALLYSYLRPFIIKTSSMQTLCDIIHILQCEIQEHLQLRRNNSVSSDMDDFDSNIPEFDRTIVRIIEDAQERLVFRTQIHLRDEIQNYVSSDTDMNYYALLRKIYGTNGSDESEEKQEIIERYSDWSPVLEKTLSVLSKIYPVLNHSVFEFLAYESVSCSVTSLVELARKMAHKSSSVHGHLFLIKHLLILREQISPFDVDFSITETTLDFGHMTQYLSHLVSQNGQYSLVEVFQHSIPTVNKHQLNSKKSMESVLKKGCESFIETQTNLLIGPLIALISKYKQQSEVERIKMEAKEEKIHPLQRMNESGNEKKDKALENNSLNKKQKQSLLDELNLTLVSCEKSLIARTEELMDVMRLYLQNELTQRILLKPIISNIQSAFIQLRKIVMETNLKNHVKLNICDDISDKLQAIVNKSSR